MKRILMFILILQLVDPGRLFSTQTETGIVGRAKVYSEYVYNHNVSYMKNRGFKGHITRKEARRLVESAYRYSNFLFSPEDILAQSQRESHFYPRAWNRHGAKGASQIVHRKWRWNKEYSSLIKSHIDLYCPTKSTIAQVFIMSWFHVRTGNKSETYARYSGYAKDYYDDIQLIKKNLLKM